jgi:butyrate kinase
MDINTILIINPGSTSTKVAVYQEDTPLFVENIQHSGEELAPYSDIYQQYDLRREVILNCLRRHGVEINSLSAVMARGGLLPPCRSGAYQVNDEMVHVLRHHPQNIHASNLGGILAKSIADQAGVKAYIYDPVTVDELTPIHKVTGLVEMERKGMGHNLNMRACAMKYAQKAGKLYEELNLIVAHLGGGITLSLHQQGRMTDMISDEEGPFSPERAGGLPVFQVVKMATSGQYDYRSLMDKIKNHAGLEAHLGTKDAQEVERRVRSGDEHAALVYKAMALNVAKNIAKLAVPVKGKVDAILLTGGIAYSQLFTGWIQEYVAFIAPIICLPGENEMEALALGCLRVLRGEEKAHNFLI